MRASLLTILLLMTVGCEDDNGPTSPSAPSLSFFVTSATSVTGNLGGLTGADATCQRLATAVGQGQRIWRAYLSVERDPANNNRPTHARDRIGTGPWYNAGLQGIRQKGEGIELRLVSSAATRNFWESFHPGGNAHESESADDPLAHDRWL